MIAAYLESHDFQVHRLFGSSATRENVCKKLQSISLCKICVVVFAGHGVAGAQGPALVPYDGGFNTHSIHDKVDQAFLQTWSRRCQAHSILFLLDSCYGGDMCVKLRSGERPSFCIDQKEKARIVISSSLKGEKVPDADSSGKHSPFCSALLESLNDDCFSGSAIELFVSTRARASALPSSSIVPKLGRMAGTRAVMLFYFRIVSTTKNK